MDDPETLRLRAEFRNAFAAYTEAGNAMRELLLALPDGNGDARTTEIRDRQTALDLAFHIYENARRAYVGRVLSDPYAESKT